MSNKLDGGRLFAKALKREGVEKVFTLSGGHITPIYYGCRAEGIEIIDVRHEVNSVYAADAYSQVTGKTGIAITTAGPGVTNTFSGMAEALGKNIPVIQIGGASFLSEADKGALQEIDTVEVMRPVSKWSRRIVETHRIPEYVSMAFRHANDSVPGPVYIEIPADVLFRSVDEEDVVYPKNYRTKAQPFGDSNLVDIAAELLINAKKPVLVTGGNACVTAEYPEAVNGLVNYLSMPVLSTEFERGLFGDESDLIWKIGGDAIKDADVILMLGVNANFRIDYGNSFNKDAKIIQVHTDKTKIGYNVPADVGIVGGPTNVAKQIFEIVESRTSKRERPLWVKELEEKILVSNEEISKVERKPLHPSQLALELSKFMDDEGRDWNLVIDGGDSGAWVKSLTSAHRPGQIFRTGPMGIIGTGPGFSLGAWAGNGKPVLYFTGDGSFGYYPMEFDTFERQGIPLVCVIANDSAWGMVKLTDPDLFPDEVKENFEGSIGSDLAYMRRYEKMAAAWEGYGEVVTEIGEIVPAIKRAIKSGKPSIINVEVGMYDMHAATKGYSLSFAKYQN